MLGILAKPYPYYIPFNTSFKLILLFSIGLPLFYLLVQPFGIYNWQCPYKTWIILGMFFPMAIVLSINFYAISKISSSFFNEEKWTVGKEIVWSFWNIVTIIVTIHYYYLVNPVCGVSSNMGSNALTIVSVSISINLISVILYMKLLTLIFKLIIYSLTSNIS